MKLNWGITPDTVDYSTSGRNSQSERIESCSLGDLLRGLALIGKSG